jgi:hypothetical protein
MADLSIPITILMSRYICAEFTPKPNVRPGRLVAQGVPESDDVAQPLANPRVVHVVVVDPVLVARVIGRVDVDALDLPAIAREEGLEGFEVVALDQEILGLGVADGKFPVTFQQSRRHSAMVLDDGFLSDPIQRWHSVLVRLATYCFLVVMMLAGIPRNRNLSQPIGSRPPCRAVSYVTFGIGCLLYRKNPQLLAATRQSSNRLAKRSSATAVVVSVFAAMSYDISIP